MYRRETILTSIGWLTVLTGCLGSSNDDHPTENNTTTTSSDTSTANSESPTTEIGSTVKISGVIAEQSTEEHPAIAELGVTNVSNVPVSIRSGYRGGDPLEWVGPLSEGPVGEVWLFPIDTTGVHFVEGGTPEERKDGCWRGAFGDDEENKPGIISHKNIIELDPGETHQIRHEIIYEGPADACFPDGRYRKELSLEILEVGSTRVDETVDYVLAVNSGPELELEIESNE